MGKENMQRTTDPQGELLPIVDAEDRVVGSISRREAHTRPDITHQIAGAFIYNQRGDILLTRRSDTKDTYPACWDVSMGGHVGYGQSYEEAALRELDEELGLSVVVADLHPLDKVTVQLPNERERWQVYRITVADDVPISPNAEEIAETKFVSKGELHEMLNSGDVRWSDKARQLFQALLFHPDES